MRAGILLALALHAAFLSPAQTTYPASTTRSLSLRECVDLALTRNLDIQIVHLNADIAAYDLAGKQLGLIGLGRIARAVAARAPAFGMRVVFAAQRPASLEGAEQVSLDKLLNTSDVVSLHVPLVEKTRHLVNAKNLKLLKAGSVLLNFSREGVVDDAAALQAIESKQLRCYVSDFPSAALIGKPGVVTLPHLGASTSEAEDNCAIMVADQVREYFAHGTMENAVNFPNAQMPRESPYRLAIANANVPNMLASISQTMGSRKINIHNMLNKSRGETAYTLVDVDSPVPDAALEDLRAIEGVLAVRYIPVE